MEITYHYPPELLQLLIDTIPRLCRSKKDVLTFFRGAGVPDSDTADVRARLQVDAGRISKFEIVRTVLSRLNERGQAALGERREVLKRVVQYEDFSTCWPEDQLKAKGLVAEIRRVVDVKDAFTRINQEREREAQARRDALIAKQREADEERRVRQKAKNELFAAFAEQNPQERGNKLEAAMNTLFAAHGISVRESFRIVSDKSGRTLEQIDGIIEFDGHLYLVEVKWVSGRVDVEDVSRHLVRVYHRGQSRGFFFSMTEFTEAALATCRDALQRTVVALALIDEIVRLLERDGDLVQFLRAKAQAAQGDRNPYYRIA